MVFNKNEFKFVVVTLAVIIAATLVNLNISYRKSRDMQRKSDIRSIYDNLLLFEKDYGFFPESTEDGKLVACDRESDGENGFIFHPCEYLQSDFMNITLPTDPSHLDGRAYFYISNGESFQILASLESKREDEYSAGIEGRNIACGNNICNFGRSNSPHVSLETDL